VYCLLKWAEVFLIYPLDIIDHLQTLKSSMEIILL